MRDGRQQSVDKQVLQEHQGLRRRYTRGTQAVHDRYTGGAQACSLRFSTLAGITRAAPPRIYGNRGALVELWWSSGGALAQQAHQDARWRWRVASTGAWGKTHAAHPCQLSSRTCMIRTTRRVRKLGRYVATHTPQCVRTCASDGIDFAQRSQLRTQRPELRTQCLSVKLFELSRRSGKHGWCVRCSAQQRFQYAQKSLQISKRT